MRIFDRYLLAQLTLLFGFFSLVLVSVYWVNRAAMLFEELIGDGQSARVFLEFSALTLPNVIRLVLPVSAFAATVYVINRLSTESELVVVRSMGFSPFRLARAVVVFGLMVTILISVLNHILVPISRAEIKERRAAIANDDAARLLREGRFIHPGDGVTFFVGNITDAGELLGVYMLDRTDPAREITYIADQALLVPGDNGPKLIMFNGTSQTLNVSDKRLSVTRFADAVYDLEGLGDAAILTRPGLKELSTPDLIAPSPLLQQQLGNTSLAEFLYEGHARISQPFLALAGSLIGFAALMLGRFNRFGFGRQIALAVLMLIGLQSLDNTVADLARRSADLWPVVYIPPVVGVIAAVVIIWLSTDPFQRFKRRSSDETSEVSP